MSSGTPLIFDIARGSFVDGAGIRTTVFFKGCPLRCVWCHNPESQAAEREAAFFSGSCIGCGRCRQVCPHGALVTTDHGITIDRNFCIACGTCADECYNDALRIIGREYSVAELFNLIVKDREFYRVSGGGVTFSGGEPLLYIDFLVELCSMLRKIDIKVAVQTSGYFDGDMFERRLLPMIETVFFDIKMVDSVKHLFYTGVSNELIMNNINRMAQCRRKSLVLTTPMVPGITDNDENLSAIGSLQESLTISTWRKLPFNRSFYHKLDALGRSAGI